MRMDELSRKVCAWRARVRNAAGALTFVNQKVEMHTQKIGSL